MPTHIVQLHDGRIVHLGRLPPLPGKPVLKLAHYLAPGGAPPPPSVDFSAKALPSIKQMYANDSLGDCVIAGKMHSVGVWTGNETGTPVVGTSAEAIASYHAICGPGDNGCVITTVLDTMKSKGLIVAGKRHLLDGYVSFDWTNQLEVQTAILLFGGGSIGFDCPQAWLNAPDGGIWDVTTTSIVGGHDVALLGYNAQGVKISTWGGTRTMTWAAFMSRTWISEAYALLAPDWYSKGNVNPMNVDVNTLRADLAIIESGGIPPMPSPSPTPTPPTPVPTPVPPPTPVPTPTPIGATIIEIDPINKTVASPPGYGLKPVHNPLPGNKVTVDFKDKQILVPGVWKVVTK